MCRIFAACAQPEEPVRTISGKCSWNIHVEALIVVANWLFVDIQLLADLSKRNITAADDRMGDAGDAVEFGDGG